MLPMVQFAVVGKKWVFRVHEVLPLGENVAVALVEHSVAHLSAMGKGSRFSIWILAHLWG